MVRLRSLLPSAIICVDEREEKDYAPLVPKDQLLLHPPMDGGKPPIMNWIIDTIQNPILIQLDDDFRGVKCIVGTHRFITDPEEILAILENSAQACKDLELTTFAYSRTPNQAMVRADFKPLWPHGPIANAKGMMGAARTRKYDIGLSGRSDVDWTLRTLLEDRCVYVDVRFYFDFGKIYSGRGGSVDLITPAQFERSTRLLKEKWGQALSFKSPNFMKTRRGAQAMSIDVTRHSPMAQK